MNYLFPNSFKKIGWVVLIPSSIIGFWLIIQEEYEPSFFDAKVPAFLKPAFPLTGEAFKYFTIIENNILNEIIGVLFIISALFVAFSKEKVEDEFIAKIRLESLVWATYFNFAILILAMLFLYEFSFLWVMIFNMFTIPIFFIIRFNWQLRKIKHYEKQH